MKLNLANHFFLATLSWNVANARLGDTRLGFFKDKETFKHIKLRDEDTNENKKGIQDDLLNNEMILVLDENYSNVTSSESVEAAVMNMINDSGAKIKHVFTNVFNGVAVTGLPNDKKGKLLDNDAIKYATHNRRVLGANYSGIQRNPTWNLDRIDQLNFPLDGIYSYDYDGSGVTAFVLDTGIRFTHSEFEGRASCGFNAFEQFESCDDLNGHGTNVAAIIGGKTFGVAKQITLKAVKVMNGDGAGTGADIIAGIDYVIGQKKANPNTPMVINMSLGGWRVETENDAVNAAVDAGIVVVVAAGNENRDACYDSPASAEKAITVGATDNGGWFFWADRRAYYSNVGSCVDIFAPGSAIASAWARSDDDAVIVDGTSQAAPHVAGAAALYMQRTPGIAPDDVWSEIKADAVQGIISWSWWRSRRSPNLFLNTEKL